MRVCPKCKSENVQEPLIVWCEVNGAKDMVDYIGEASGYSYWCEDCGEEQDHLIEKEDADQPAFLSIKEWAEDLKKKYQKLFEFDKGAIRGGKEMNLVEQADAVLHFVESQGMSPEEAAMVVAAILCALTSEVETAHEIINAIDNMATNSPEGMAHR